MIAALRAAETKTERSGGAGRKGGVGGMNSRPALASAAAIFCQQSWRVTQNFSQYSVYVLILAQKPK